MREIKFRGWHSKAKEMVYETYDGEVFIWKYQGQPIEIMQFTGLLDKSGKEIYEGDLVETDRGIDEVFYEWGGIWLGTLTLNHANSLGDLEIIGNIYENSELLKEVNHE